MGEDQQLCLHWNEFQTAFSSAFSQLRKDDDFLDVTLACDGKQLQAHKLVLSACSPLFKDLLKRNPCQHPIIILHNTSYEHVMSILDFVYEGEVYIDQRSLNSFLEVGDKLQICGLAKGNNDSIVHSKVDNHKIDNKGPIPLITKPLISKLHINYKKAISRSIIKANHTNGTKTKPSSRVESTEPIHQDAIKEEAMDLSQMLECSLDSNKITNNNELAETINVDNCKFALINGYNNTQTSSTSGKMKKRSPVYCPICSKVLSRTDHLRRHMMYIHSNVTPKVLCKFCNRVFKNPESLRSHIGLYHKRGRKCQASSSDTNGDCNEVVLSDVFKT